MNGVRSTYMRQGWVLSALAALVLIAGSPGTVEAQITDIAVRSVTVDAATAAGVVDEGTSSNVTVTLNKAVPVGDTVTVTIAKAYAAGAAGDTGNAEDTDVVVGTTVIVPSGSSTGSTPIIFGLDSDAVDEAFRISATAIAIDTTGTTAVNTVDSANLPLNSPASGKIKDAQEQTYKFTTGTIASQIQEGAEIAFTLTAAPPRPTNEDVTLHLAAPRGYTIGGTNVTAATAAGVPANVSLTSTEAATGQAVTLTGPSNDQNRTDDVVALAAHLGTAVQSTQVAMAEVTVLDLHQLPASDAITAEARDNERRDLGAVIESVAEGDTAYVWVAVINSTQDRVDDAEMFTVDVTAADSAQALDARITRPSGDRKTQGSARGTLRLGPWVIEVQEDEDVGMENLMLDIEVEGTAANGGGSANGSFSLGIEDNTEKKVWPLPEAEAYPAITGAMEDAAGDNGLNPGESFTVMTSDLFGLMEGYTAAYAASVEGGAVSVSASGDSVTVNAVAVGESKVTVTATAKASSSFQAEQTVSNVASIMFPVAVVAVPEPPVEDKNAIEANPQDDAYPIIEAAIEAGAGDEGLNPGESVMVDAADLFTVMEGYTATYAASVEGDAASSSVSGSHVSLMADMLGEAKVTITGTATAASSSFEAGQPAANVATVTFPLMVVDKALTIYLHAPDNVMEGNLVEGQSYTLTVKANRVVREDTAVSFGRDRSMSDAEEGTDYELNDVTMLAGSDSVKATLDVLEDMEADAGTNDNMGEALVIYAMAGDAQSDDLMLTIWDQAVPVLPVIGQALLALFLMLGGARLYRRRQG